MNDFNNKNSKDISSYVEEFKYVRKNSKQAIIDDYLELISDLNITLDKVRQIDIAIRLGVSQPTVAKMIKRLISSGLVKQSSYKKILLTNIGKKLAKKIKKKHHIVKNFLIALGSNPKIANLDAEGIEHYVSNETLIIFQNFFKKENISKMY